MIRYKCKACGMRLENPDEVAGKRDQCPNCDAFHTVPLSKAQKQGVARAQKAEWQLQKQKQRELAGAADRLRRQQEAEREGAKRQAAGVEEPSPSPLLQIEDTGSPAGSDRSKRQARRFAIGSGVAALVIIPLIIYAVNYFSLQSAMNDILSKSGNSGIEASVHYGGYLDGDTLVYDLESVSGSNSMADVFRVFLQFAEKMQSKEFDTVKLCFRGDERFQIDGVYFRRLGRDYAHENVVYTIRTFPEHLKTASGSDAFPPRSGGWLYVMGKQMEDFNEFHRKWYMADLMRDVAPGFSADELTGLESPPESPSVGDPPAVQPVKSFEIVAINTRVTETNDIWWKYAWKLTLRSNSNRPLVLEAEIKFLDRDGFIVDTDTEYGLLLQPKEERDFTGYALIKSGPAAKVANTEALVGLR